VNEKCNESYFARIIADAIRPLHEQYDDQYDQRADQNIDQDIDQDSVDFVKKELNIPVVSNHKNNDIKEHLEVDLSDKIETKIENKLDIDLKQHAEKISIQKRAYEVNVKSSSDKRYSDTTNNKKVYQESTIQKYSHRNNSFEDNSFKNNGQENNNLEKSTTPLKKNITQADNSTAKTILKERGRPITHSQAEIQEKPIQNPSAVVAEALIAKNSYQAESHMVSSAERGFTSMDIHRSPTSQTWSPTQANEIPAQKIATTKLHIGQVNIKVVDSMQNESTEKLNASRLKKVAITPFENNAADSRTFLRSL
jgi:hypothetical protein